MIAWATGTRDGLEELGVGLRCPPTFKKEQSLTLLRTFHGCCCLGALEEQGPKSDPIRLAHEPPTPLLRVAGQPTWSDARVVPQWPPLGQSSLHCFLEQRDRGGDRSND